jgi:putative oxidoreductase
MGVSERYRDFGLLVLRVGMGVMFIFHGWPLLIGGLAVWEKTGAAIAYVGIKAFPIFWGFMAAFSEFFGGIALILGLFFRPACMLLAITMAVAASMHIGKGEGLKAASQAIEAGVVFLSLVFIGPGTYSFGKK